MMTAHEGRRTWVRRILLFGLVALAHSALLIAFLVAAPAPLTRPVDPPILLGFAAITAAPAAAKAPPTPSQPAAGPPLVKAWVAPSPSDLVLPAPPPAVPSPAPSAPQSASLSAPLPSIAATAETCDMLARLQQRLRTDPEALKALQSVPSSARSVANAILLWDGTWTDAQALGGVAVFGPLHDAVVQTVRSAPPACQTEQVRGPRLIAVPDGKGSTIVGLGSGLWRWTDLMGETP